MKRIIIVIILVGLIGIFSAMSLYYTFFTVNIQELNMDLIVDDHIGFNTQTDALHFGTMFLGGQAERELTVSNDNRYPVIVNIKNTGNCSDFVTVDKNNFLVPSKNNHTIKYTMNLPMTANKGNYDGVTRLTIKRKLW